MGHAHHFLSRLDRISLPHVELALSLYRDDALLRFILQQARIPEQVERVAISMKHPERGPFLVVTRDGHFVTCLGEGMSPGALPVIHRGQLDGLGVRYASFRERIAICEKLSGERGGTGKLFRRIYEAGEWLSREELVAISAFQPLVRIEFLRFLTAANDDLREARTFFEAQMRRADKLDRRHDERLRAYWQVLWAVGHLVVLVALDGRELLEELPEDMRPLLTHDMTISWVPVRQGMVAIAARGLWAAGRIGKAHLPAYKRRYAGSGSFLTTINGALGLAVLGLRHARLRAEVGKALSVEPDTKVEGPYGKLIALITEIARKIYESASSAEIAQDCATMQRSMGAARGMALGVFLPEGSPYRFAKAEDVPEQLAMCLAVNHPADLVSDAETPLHFAAMAPWLAHASAEDLYLPADYVEAVRVPWFPERTLQALRALQHPRIRPRTRKPHEQSGPSRKGPCTCGSGKKYKRCCGAAKR